MNHIKIFEQYTWLFEEQTLLTINHFVCLTVRDQERLHPIALVILNSKHILQLLLGG